MVRETGVRSHTEDSKMVLDAFLLNTQCNKVQIKGKSSNPEKGIATSPTPQYKTKIYIYTYIYCHPQADCFVVSQLFSVARHVGRLKRNPSNFTLNLVSDRSANGRSTSAREL